MFDTCRDLSKFRVCSFLARRLRLQNTRKATIHNNTTHPATDPTIAPIGVEDFDWLLDREPEVSDEVMLTTNRSISQLEESGLVPTTWSVNV